MNRSMTARADDDGAAHRRLSLIDLENEDRPVVHRVLPDDFTTHVLSHPDGERYMAGGLPGLQGRFGSLKGFIADDEKLDLPDTIGSLADSVCEITRNRFCPCSVTGASSQ